MQHHLTGQDLGGKTLTPGVYCFDSSAQLTGTLTLDAQGNPSAIFLFQTGSSLTTASGSSVLLINGASSCGVSWQVGSSATLGTGTSLSGSIVALTSITLNTGAGMTGSALARNGAVTLDTNQVSLCGGTEGLKPPTISKVFGLGTLPLNGSTSLSLTIANPNNNPMLRSANVRRLSRTRRAVTPDGTTLTGVAVTDPLPAGLVVATPNGLTGSCGGGAITATAGSSTLTLSGGTLAGLASCTFSINVIGTTLGLKNNITSDVTANESGPGNAASASLTVAGGIISTATPAPAMSLPMLAALASFLAALGSVLMRRARTPGP